MQDFNKVVEHLKANPTKTKKQTCIDLKVKPLSFYAWETTQRRKAKGPVKTTNISNKPGPKAGSKRTIIATNRHSDPTFSNLSKTLEEAMRIASRLQNVLK